jgi:hypothetical protein
MAVTGLERGFRGAWRRGGRYDVDEAKACPWFRCARARTEPGLPACEAAGRAEKSSGSHNLVHAGDIGRKFPKVKFPARKPSRNSGGVPVKKARRSMYLKFCRKSDTKEECRI